MCGVRRSVAIAILFAVALVGCIEICPDDACSDACPGEGCTPSTPQAGDACSQIAQINCGTDRRVLRCNGGVYEIIHQCPPGMSCGLFSTEDAFFCSIGSTQEPHAVPGDACKVDGAALCSLDKQQTLACQAGRWACAQT